MSSLVEQPVQRGEIRFRVPSGAEATVLRSDFGVAFRALPGESNVSLPPGIYKVIEHAGDASRSRLVEVVAGRASDVDVAPVAFASAAPLTATRKTHEYHVAAAQELSNGTPLAMGAGAQAFFFSRYWTGSGGEETPSAAPSHPLHGLSLRRVDGSHAIELEAVSQWERGPRDSFAWCLLALDPGTYRLRTVTRRYGAVEQSLVLCRGWQTHVYTLVRDLDPAPAEDMLPDTSTAAILMSPIGTRFDVGAHHLRLTEVARLALESNRPLVSQLDLQHLLWGKFENPMLGIMGAHLAARDGAFSMNELEPVITNLEGLVQGHPDVVALRLGLEGLRPPATRAPFVEPPMLARSWDLVARRAVTDRALIPDGSLTATVGAARWGSSAWLAWLVDEAEESPAERPSAGAAPTTAAGAEPAPAAQAEAAPAADEPARLESELEAILGRLPVTLLSLDAREAELTGLEAAVARALMRATTRPGRGRRRARAEEMAGSPRFSDLESIGLDYEIPASSMKSILEGLERKLTR